MRIESSITSVSWIPSAAITGATRIPFEVGVMHYDDPPPDEWKDLDSVLGPEGARFANELRGWIEVENGRIVGYGQGGGGRVQHPRPSAENAGPRGGGRLSGAAARTCYR
jgi:hypothetical protein